MKIYRQGDVLFKQIETIPSDVKKRTSGHILEGESTGHIHRVEDLATADVLECGVGLYLNVTAEGGVSIIHEEHNTLVLPAGNYEITRQREYSPEAIRNVLD